MNNNYDEMAAIPNLVYLSFYKLKRSCNLVTEMCNDFHTSLYIIYIF